MGSPPLKGILETALYVDDLGAAAEFYGEIIGLEKVTKVPGRHLFYRCGSGMLLLFIAEKTQIPPNNPDLPVPPHGASGAGHMCFSACTRDLDYWRDHLDANGIEIEADFLWPNNARSIYVRDPAGNSIEFSEPGLWGLDA